MDKPTHKRDGHYLDAREMLADPKYLRLFLAKIDHSGGPDSCWPWMAARAVNGYGVYGIGAQRGRSAQQAKAHRLAWSLENGPIPVGLVVRHTCDNPPCCNPAHLTLGTGQDNVNDKVERGRQSRGSRHAKIMQAVHARGERSGNAKLTADAARFIRASDLPSRLLADRFGVDISQVQRIRAGSAWTHIT